jgi:hypothetical protein
MLVFARTKQATEELAEKLQARGFSAAAINGDIVQAQRERTIQQLKDGKLDILVATDVAARGLDVERISHVLNYDIPTDTEAYVHRIGRTGRAGRSGEAILFVAPREKRMLQAIERATRQPIAEMQLPSVEAVNDQRITKFKQRIVDALGGDDLGPFRQLIETFEQERNVPAVEIAAALARLVQGNEPLLLKPPSRADANRDFSRDAREPRAFERPARPERSDRSQPPGARAFDKPRFEKPGVDQARFDKPRSEKPRFEKSEAPGHDDRSASRASRPDAPSYPAAGGALLPKTPFGPAAPDARSATRPPRSHHEEGRRDERIARMRRDDRPHVPEQGFETFRIEVGVDHGVQPGNIVGAIANEAGLDSKNIGRVDIRGDHSLVDLPSGMPSEIFKHLKRCGYRVSNCASPAVEKNPISASRTSRTRASRPHSSHAVRRPAASTSRSGTTRKNARADRGALRVGAREACASHRSASVRGRRYLARGLRNEPLGQAQHRGPRLAVPRDDVVGIRTRNLRAGDPHQAPRLQRRRREWPACQRDADTRLGRREHQVVVLVTALATARPKRDARVPAPQSPLLRVAVVQQDLPQHIGALSSTQRLRGLRRGYCEQALAEQRTRIETRPVAAPETDRKVGVTTVKPGLAMFGRDLDRNVPLLSLQGCEPWHQPQARE